RAVSLDFNVSHGPMESKSYEVEYGPDVASGPEPRGLRVEEAADEIRILHPGGLRFVVPRDLLGLLRSVRTQTLDFVRTGSAGLYLRDKDNRTHRVGGSGPGSPTLTVRVVKEGPLAAALRFESGTALRGVTSVVEMEFPISKSWVQVAWTVD